MKIYFAPMEGITTYTYRNLHRRLYSGVEKYYAPFVSPGPEQGLSVKEIRDLLPENNEKTPLVPQLMTNRSADFADACRVVSELGYREINLNLGCPSGTVVSKKKGSGFLAYPDELDRFFDGVFEDPFIKSGAVDISVKTRTGKESHEEWPRLMEIYNRYPLKELIIHPRVQKDHYNNTPDQDVFEEAVKNSVNPVVFNGDLFRIPEFFRFMKRFPDTEAVMIGRGLIRNPELAERIGAFCRAAEELRGKTEDRRSCAEDLIGPETDRFDKDRFKNFHDSLILEYRERMSGEIPVLYKMKELWFYMASMFPDREKAKKKIKKSKNLAEYQAAVEDIFL